ncbi:MAG: hypothetical protein AAF702_24380 [Chloroflexota bacterium]
MTKSFQRNSVEKSYINLDVLPKNTQNANYSNMIADTLMSSPVPLSAHEIDAALGHSLPKGTDIHRLIEQTADTIFQVVQCAPDQYGWLSNLIKGSIIRHPLTADEAEQGFLLLDELEHAVLFPEFFQTHRSEARILYIELFGGPTIPAEAYIEQKTWSLRLGPQFVAWVDEQGGEGRDDILITANDVNNGQYMLRLHPREARDDSLIQSRNVQLTLKAEEIVRKIQKSKGSITSWDLAAQLLADEVYRDAIPPDDLHCVLHQYSLLHFDSNVGYVLKEDVPGNIDAFSNHHLFTSDQSEEPMTEPKYDFSTLDSGIPNLSDLATPNGEYDQYLDKLFRSGIMDSPFTEDEYCILRAELESLVTIERQFGYLLAEQRNRQNDLLACLLVDVDSLNGTNMDYPNQNDYDEPPYLER